MKINLYKLHYLSSHFSTQPNKRVFYPSTFLPLLIFIPLDNSGLILVSNKKEKLMTTAHPWCSGHSTSINTCEVWEARIGV